MKSTAIRMVGSRHSTQDDGTLWFQLRSLPNQQSVCACSY